jgi:predicted transcriptional regulator
MMVCRRSRKEILLAVLETVSKGSTKKTHIMYQCNLSWSMINDAIETLLERSLIKLDQKHYCITNEGLNVLKIHRRLEEELSNVPKMLQ